MKANSNKSNLLLGSESDMVVTEKRNGDIISNSKSKKLLDCRLTFDKHIF